MQKKLMRVECAPAHFWKRRRNLCLSSFCGGGLLADGEIELEDSGRGKDAPAMAVSGVQGVRCVRL